MSPDRKSVISLEDLVMTFFDKVKKKIIIKETCLGESFTLR